MIPLQEISILFFSSSDTFHRDDCLISSLSSFKALLNGTWHDCHFTNYITLAIFPNPQTSHLSYAFLIFLKNQSTYYIIAKLLDLLLLFHPKLSLSFSLTNTHTHSCSDLHSVRAGIFPGHLLRARRPLAT